MEDMMQAYVGMIVGILFILAISLVVLLARIHSQLDRIANGFVEIAGRGGHSDDVKAILDRIAKTLDKQSAER